MAARLTGATYRVNGRDLRLDLIGRPGEGGRMKSLTALLIAAAVTGNLCCIMEDGQGVCSTDMARDGSHPVKLERTKQGGITAIVRGHPSINDGAYKCESIAPVGTPVF